MDFYPESRFGGFTDIDGTIAFFTRVNALLQPSFVLLDVGCGRGAYGEDVVKPRRDLRILRGKVEQVIGIDVDEAARNNPYIDAFRMIDGPRWPVEDSSVDMIVCDNVVEHIEDPASFFGEIRRVLKDDGLVCIRTSNRWSYVCLAASIIPNKYHSAVLSRVQRGRLTEDVFPTVYRCNSSGALRRMLRRHGFNAVVYGYEAEPGYLAFSKITYALGVFHQKYAPKFLKPALFAFGRLSK